MFQLKQYFQQQKRGKLKNKTKNSADFSSGEELYTVFHINNLFD
jgi:hypothetical protein